MLGSFRCGRNPDIETYLKTKAVTHEKLNISRTYLIMDDEFNILAYFTLLIKPIMLNDLSRAKRKEIASHLEIRTDSATGYLLGQFGKNDLFKSEISGQVMWDYAYNIILRCHINVGLRFVYLECENVQGLIHSYHDKGFEILRHNDENGFVLMIKMIDDRDAYAVLNQ